MQEKLELQFNQTAKKIQSYGSDILGVGMIYRPYLTEKQVNAWKTILFPKLTQHINVKINVLNELYFKENVTDKQEQGKMLKKNAY